MKWQSKCYGYYREIKMHIITFTNPKGGTGKTTSTLLIAEQLHRADIRVKVLDLDPNKNLVHWKNKRAEQGKPELFEIINGPDDESEILPMVEAQEATTDVLLIDLEGLASSVTIIGLSWADMAIVPLKPNAVEARHASKAIKGIETTSKQVKRNIPYKILFNRQSGAIVTKEEKGVREAIKKHGVDILKHGLMERSAYTQIFGEHTTLSELLEGASNEQLRKRYSVAQKNAALVAQEIMENFGE